MRVLVTGSHGFVGRHLTDELRSRGHDVWGCDLNHAPDEHVWAFTPDVPRPQYMRCNISEYRQLYQLLDVRGPFDIVYHTAGEFGRHNGRDAYETMWRTNVIGTAHLLEIQKEERFKLIHFSTSEVYGDFSGTMREDAPEQYPLTQLNDYAISKRVNELQIRNAAIEHGTESVIVRLFNAYGPGEHYSPYRSALGRFIYCALHGLPFTVYRGHRRSWLFVRDLVRTLANIPEHWKAGEVYNLGNPDAVSMEDLGQLVCEMTAADQGLMRLEGHEPRTTREKRVDVSKAVQELGHDIRYPLETGIVLTIDWMRHTYPREGTHAQ